MAAYPPPEAAKAMLALLGGLDLGRHRPVPGEQVHMTLHFIGDTPAGSLEATLESVRRAAAGVRAFSIEIERLATLPEHGAARLLAAVARPQPAAVELHDRLARRLASPDRSSKGFLPHLTLCRFTPPNRGFRWDQAVKGPSWKVDRVCVVRSVLGQGGARHEEVAAAGLVDG